MLTNHPLKHAIAFIDGQSLYHYARESFDYTFSNHNQYPFPLSKRGENEARNTEEKIWAEENLSKIMA